MEVRAKGEGDLLAGGKCYNRHPTSHVPSKLIMLPTGVVFLTILPMDVISEVCDRRFHPGSLDPITNRL